MENWSSLERVVGSTKQQRRGGLANLEVRIEAFFFFLNQEFPERRVAILEGISQRERWLQVYLVWIRNRFSRELLAQRQAL